MSTPTALVADRYRLVKLLGAGGMGVVWQAWDERLHRTVALKMMRAQPELTDREREIVTTRAMREARITAGLHHPHAVTVFDVVEHDGRPCIVMQLIESTPLSAILKEHGRLTPLQTARIGAHVSSALAAAHKLRIVHRDVKPGNVLITENGSAMISDFGISHALGDPTLTATGMIHGTPAYLSPEVARGQESTFASDVFSLGSTLYAMLEGAPPFGADNNAIALLHKVARGSYPAPTHAAELASLLGEMLSADPKLRPDMSDVASRLSGIYTTLRRAADDSPAAPLPTEPLAGPAAPAAHPYTARRGSAGAAAVPAPMIAPPDRPAETLKLPETKRYDAPTEHVLTAARTPPSSAPPSHPGLPRRRRLVGFLLVAALLLLGVFVLTTPLRQGANDAGGLSVVDSPSASEVPSPAESPIAAATPSAEAQPSEAPQPEIQPSDPPQRETSPSPAQPAPAEPEPAEPKPAEPEPSAAPEPTPDEAEEQAAPGAAQEPVEAITAYYGLLPDDLAGAWPMMTANYQVNHVGGRGAYEQFWGTVSDLAVSDVRSSAPDRAQATLTYYFADGRVVREVTAYRLADEDGMLKIAATTVLSSVRL